MDLQGSSIVQENLILSINVSTPVTDLNRAFKIENFQHRLVMVIMHRNRLLILVDEINQSTRWNVVVRSIYHCCTRLGNEPFVSESLDVLGCCVRNYIRRAGSSMIKEDKIRHHLIRRETLLDFCTLYTCRIRAEDKQLRGVFKCLFLILSNTLRVWSSHMGLNRLKYDIQGLVKR